jgi:hypothetical protein
MLVWQEDHRRWPTAVAPPCVMDMEPVAFSQHFCRDGCTSRTTTVAATSTGATVATHSAPRLN